MTKLLIVDDEEYIRDGIALKIERLAPHVQIVGMAEDAEQAMGIVKSQHPDIIVTDIRMPEIDGLQFIESVKNVFDDIKFIIVSGYQDFEFAKKAIILGVEDYLLKPIKNAELKNTLEKVEEKIKLERNNEKYFMELKTRERTNLNSLKNKYLTDIVENISSFETDGIRRLLERIDIKFVHGYFSVITIIISDSGRISTTKSIDDISLIKFAVMNIAEEILSRLGKIVSFEYLKKENHVVVIINHGSSIDTKVSMFCKELLSAFNKYLALDAVIGIGNHYGSICDLHNSYIESYTAAMQKIILGSNIIIHFNDVPESNLVTFFLSDNERSLFTCYINSQNIDEAFEFIDNVFSTIKAKNISYINLKALYIDISIMLGRILKSCGGSWESVFREDIFSESHVSSFATLDDLRDWMKECIKSILSYLSEFRKNGGKKVIVEIKKYIENYYYTDINLNNLAHKYFMNFSYLSQLFKSETRQNFIDYITKVRVEKAKELLLTTSLKSYEIAEMVGYSDSRYFSDVFSKYVGVTPSKFRE